MLLNEPQTFWWLEKGSQVGWASVDSNGHVLAASECFQGELLGKRLAHLPAEWSMVRLIGVASIPRQAIADDSES